MWSYGVQPLAPSVGAPVTAGALSPARLVMLVPATNTDPVVFCINYNIPPIHHEYPVTPEAAADFVCVPVRAHTKALP